MNQLSGEPYTAYIGIDWASTKHDICLQLAGGEAGMFVVFVGLTVIAGVIIAAIARVLIGRTHASSDR